VRDVFPSLEDEYPEVHVNVDRQQAGLVGVSARDAAQTTLESTYGNINTPSTWIDPANGMAYYVVTAYNAGAVEDPAALAAMPVRVGKNGGAVTLGSYGKVERDVGAVAVERNKLQRVAHIYMQTEGRDIGSAATELEQKLRADPSTKDVPFEFVGQVQLMRDTFGGLGLAIGLAIMVVFMIMASQFKSLRLPMVMLFTIPGTLIGIVAALMAAGQGFSVTALMGVLMVVGIAVSNGILLVEHASRQLRKGHPQLEAVVDAARTRFKPILMTSLATIVGLLPTALGLEQGAEANQPLALAVVGGLASSTVLSLFLVPSIFMLLAKPEVIAAEEPMEQRHPGQAPPVASEG
jgi:multidrug efflux pump subunit AcrB